MDLKRENVVMTLISGVVLYVILALYFQQGYAMLAVAVAVVTVIVAWVTSDWDVGRTNQPPAPVEIPVKEDWRTSEQRFAMEMKVLETLSQRTINQEHYDHVERMQGRQYSNDDYQGDKRHPRDMEKLAVNKSVELVKTLAALQLQDPGAFESLTKDIDNVSAMIDEMSAEIASGRVSGVQLEQYLARIEMLQAYLVNRSSQVAKRR